MAADGDGELARRTFGAGRRQNDCFSVKTLFTIFFGPSQWLFWHGFPPFHHAALAAGQPAGAREFWMTGVRGEKVGARWREPQSKKTQRAGTLARASVFSPLPPQRQGGRIGLMRGRDGYSVRGQREGAARLRASLPFIFSQQRPFIPGCTLPDPHDSPFSLPLFRAPRPRRPPRALSR